MKKAQLKVNDTYEIVAASIFNDYDRKILVRLYQPIIGYEAIILYFNLWSELEGDQTISKFEKTHDRLVETMQCSIKVITESLLKLEAIGLVQTYFSEEEKNNRYVYFLRSPKSPKNFYETDVLDVLLKNALDPLEYERTKQYFTTIFHLKHNFQEVTAQFCEVFKLANLSAQAVAKQNQEARTIDHQEASLVLNFDFAGLQEKLNEYQISLNRFTNEDKQVIANLAIAYDISLVDLKTLLLGAINHRNNQLDISKLRTNVRKFVGAPKLVEPASNNTSTTLTGNDAYDKKLAMFNELTPLEFLRYRSNNQPVMDADAYLIADLKSKTSLSDGVINVILDFTLQQNDNRLGKAYVQKVAASLIRSKILSDTYQAMIYLNKGYRRITSKPEVKESKITNEVTDQDVADALAEFEAIKVKVKKDGKTKL